MTIFFHPKAMPLYGVARLSFSCEPYTIHTHNKCVFMSKMNLQQIQVKSREIKSEK